MAELSNDTNPVLLHYTDFVAFKIMSEYGLISYNNNYHSRHYYLLFDDIGIYVTGSGKNPTFCIFHRN